MKIFTVKKISFVPVLTGLCLGLASCGEEVTSYSTMLKCTSGQSLIMTVTVSKDYLNRITDQVDTYTCGNKFDSNGKPLTDGLLLGPGKNLGVPQEGVIYAKKH
ncbi:MAG: hypothetical protein H7230_03575 [Candidatus Parcubacteria bacterium]|nr:hypothetical protein [Candidatus Paceibacterota bacterium]